MTLESLLKDYATFNLWANTELVNWLKTKPQELMETEIPSSFPNLKLTLLHIWSAEDIWLKRLQQENSPNILALNFTGDTDEVMNGILANSEAFQHYVQSLHNDAFQEIIDFKLLNGTQDSRPRTQMIHHCMNHSTYHRGQIVTIARNLGLTDPPATDFIKYIRQFK